MVTITRVIKLDKWYNMVKGEDDVDGPPFNAARNLTHTIDAELAQDRSHPCRRE